jgi:hypothetical protein
LGKGILGGENRKIKGSAKGRNKLGHINEGKGDSKLETYRTKGNVIGNIGHGGSCL